MAEKIKTWFGKEKWISSSGSSFKVQSLPQSAEQKPKENSSKKVVN